MKMEEKNTFNYAYSASEQDEIERIKKQYMPKTESKMEKLRRLDASVHSKATMWSIIVGVIGSLIMGSGMSLIMTDLALSIGITSSVLSMLLGIILGIVGGILASLAYPVYNAVTRHERAKVRDEIIKLSDELLG
jgi:hypothetical protein